MNHNKNAANSFDDLMTAVSFAEAGDHKTAREYLRTPVPPGAEKNAGSPRRKALLVACVTCVLSACLYAGLLTNQLVINDYFSRGGLFAFLPILTAFVFSFVHGSFTGNFWTALGVEASKRKTEVR